LVEREYAAYIQFLYLSFCVLRIFIGSIFLNISLFARNVKDFINQIEKWFIHVEGILLEVVDLNVLFFKHL
jgi:hypothetical protein